MAAVGQPIGRQKAGRTADDDRGDEQTVSEWAAGGVECDPVAVKQRIERRETAASGQGIVVRQVDVPCGYYKKCAYVCGTREGEGRCGWGVLAGAVASGWWNVCEGG